MSMRNYSISGLLPVKNGEQYIAELLISILPSMNPSDELIVINDGSSDETFSIVKEFASNDSRITLISTPGIGLVKALNIGVDEARHDWLARYDVDDIYNILRLDKQRALIDDNVAVIFSDYSLVTSSGTKLGTIPTAVNAMPTALSLISGQRTPHPIALINRKLLIRSGGYLKKDYPAEDLGLWLRMSHFGNIVSVPEVLLKYRITASSISAQNRVIQLSKKSELLRSHTLWLIWQRNCVDEFLDTTYSYRQMRDSHKRILLHLRDLHLAEKFTGEKLPTFKLLNSLGVITLVKIFFAGIEMVFSTLFRRIYRL
jgi:glycosyltransferase involved in cell wall biosynthesis